MRIAIKPQHQQIVKDLQTALGGVNATDAVGFLLQRRGRAEIGQLGNAESVSRHLSPQQDTTRHNATQQGTQEPTAFDTFEQLGI